MELHGMLQICLAIMLISFYIFKIYFLRKQKILSNWSHITDSLPWIILNIHRFHDVTVDIMHRKMGTYLCKGNLFGSTDFLLTVDPTNIHYITTLNFPNYPKGDQYRKIFDVMGYALFNSDDEDWKHYRRLIHSPIKSRIFMNYSINTAHAKLENVLGPLLRHVSKGHSHRVLDIQDVFQRFALDVVCKALTGQDPESLAIEFPKVPFLGALSDFEASIIYRSALPEVLWKLQLLVGVGPEVKLSRARKVIGDYISNIVSKKRHDVISWHEKVSDDSDEDKEDADLLTLLMKDIMKNDETTNTTQITNINDDKFFQDITLQQLIAGRDTTSSAMTWFIWLISTHPRVERKILDEIRSIIPSAKEEQFRVFNYEETKQLVYLHATLNESLRLYPPAPFQYKTPRNPDVLPSGHRVTPRTKILFTLYAMARMMWLWGDNCSEFEPERWITAQGAIKREPSSKYLVFYAGPRSCMGKEAAMTQMKMVLATLVYNFRFEIVDGQVVEPDVSMILHVKNGLKVKVHSRWD